MSRRAAAPLALAALALAAAAPAARSQQKKGADGCPWCRNDPKVLQAAGLVGHGPMPLGLGPKPSDEVARRLPGPPWRFLETPHVRLGSSLGQEVVTLAERPRVEADLDELRKALPSVPKKVQVLDPWLRLHLLGMKCERLYARFLGILAVKDADFPESRIHGSPFMGNGRFLGEKDKFELMIHADRKTHFLWTEETTGARVTDALRWHLKEPHKMIASLQAEDADLRQEKFLWPHAAHNLTHLLFGAYKHFSWDPPVWLDEGLAHAMELEAAANEVNITFCGEEGAAPERERGRDWLEASRRLVAKQDAPSLADLMARKNFSELRKNDHVASWAKVRFLADAHGEKFARLLGDMKGRLDENGQPTGKDLPGFTREALKRLWGWAPADLDREWALWLAKQK